MNDDSQHIKRLDMRRRGFTLVEVLLAVFITALGVLGLAAVFAGAVAQQQRATEVNRSVGVTRNAEALLRHNLGTLEGPGLTALRDEFEGQWLRLPVHARFGGAGSLNSSIGLPPVTPGPGARVLNDTVFFAVPQPSILFLDQPDTGAGAPQGVILSVSPNTNQLAFGGELPFGGLSPERFTLQCTVTGVINLGGGPTPIGGNIISVDRTFTLDQYTNPPLPGQRPVGTLDFVSNNTLDPPGETLDDFVRVDFGDQRAGRPAQIETVSLEDAEQQLEALATAAGGVLAERWISRLELVDVFRENRDLVSINDRLVYTEDPEYPTGERPIMGYTALYRLLDNASQMAIITYSLRAVDRPRGSANILPFVPPEEPNDVANEESLVRAVEVELGFDDTRDQYYLLVEEGDLEDDGWVIEPGQILFMADSDACPNAVNPMQSRPGADAPVRVLSQQELVDAGGDVTVRGYLDDSPRFANGRSPLSCFTSQIDENARARIRVYGLFPTIRSESTQTEWRLRPVEVRIFQLSGES